MVRDINYDPIDVTDWASSLGQEFEKERRNRNIHEAQVNNVLKQAEAAHPGVTALKVVKKTIDFSATAKKQWDETSRIKSEEGRMEEWASQNKAGISIDDYNAANEIRTTEFKEGDTFESLLRKRFNPKGIKDHNEAKIQYFLNLTGKRQIRADEVAALRKVQSLPQLLAKKHADGGMGLPDSGGVSLNDLVQAGNLTEDEAYGKVYNREFYGLSPRTMKTLIDPEFKKFKETKLGSTRTKADKLAVAAVDAENKDELILHISSATPGVGTEALNNQYQNIRANVPNTGSEAGNNALAKKIFKARLSTITGEVSPTALANALGGTIKHKGYVSKKNPEGLVKLADVLYENDAAGLQELQDANLAAWNEKVEKEHKAKISATNIEASKILTADLAIQDPSKFQSEALRLKSKLYSLGANIEKIERIENASLAPKKLGSLSKRIDEQIRLGDYKSAKKIIDNSGNILLEAKYKEKVDAGAILRESDLFKNTLRESTDYLKGFVTIKPLQHLGTEEQLVIADVNQFFQNKVTEYKNAGISDVEAITQAKTDRDNYWKNNGGGTKDGPGKFSWNTKANKNKGGFEMHEKYRQRTGIKPTVDKLRTFNQELSDAFTNTTKLDQVLTTSESVLTKEDILDVEQSGKYTPELLWKAHRIGIPPSILYSEQVKALQNSTNEDDVNFVKTHGLGDIETLDFEAEKTVNDWIIKSEAINESNTLRAVLNKRGLENLSPNQLKRLVSLKDLNDIETNKILWPRGFGKLETRPLFSRGTP